ncbi:MAG: 5-carboxymethyl-2-hydroxymuconate semialdehyde dehydrogenase [Rhizobiaceae bacterium]
MTTLDDNMKKLNGYLKEYQGQVLSNRINGKDVTSKKVMEARSPFDNSLICEVSEGSAEDIDAAAKAAEAAFPAWRDMPGKERKKILHAVADAIVERAEEIALVESWDTGQAIRFMSKAALRGAANFRYFADMAEGARDGQTLPTPDHMNITTRTPIGPIGVITPWNTPFMLSTWKIAPALAAGCTVVHKPAEWSPLTARLLVEIAEGAGLPKGVWNMVNGVGEEAGKALTEHPSIKAVAFVGESSTGSAIMRQGSETLKRVHFELGGKNPVVVFDDANFERALDAAIFMIYSLNGERCTSSSRVLIQAGIHDKFVAALEDRVNKLKVGHPLDPATEIGPLIHPRHLSKVVSYLDIAKEDGARVACRGDAHEGDGYFVGPTLYADATKDMRIAQEEIFGPVLTAMKFTDEAEALEIANSVAYGLAGYVWTQDVTRALRFSDGLEAGMIWVNSENVRHLATPFGGTKASGIGRDGGDWSFDFYMETKNIAIALGEHKIPKLGV